MGWFSLTGTEATAPLTAAQALSGDVDCRVSKCKSEDDTDNENLIAVFVTVIKYSMLLMI